MARPKVKSSKPLDVGHVEEIYGPDKVEEKKKSSKTKTIHIFRTNPMGFEEEVEVEVPIE